MRERSKLAAATEREARRRRLAEALRTNLKRRKEQERARRAADGEIAEPRAGRSEGD